MDNTLRVWDVRPFCAETGVSRCSQDTLTTSRRICSTAPGHQMELWWLLAARTETSMFGTSTPATSCTNYPDTSAVSTMWTSTTLNLSSSARDQTSRYIWENLNPEPPTLCG